MRSLRLLLALLLLAEPVRIAAVGDPEASGQTVGPFLPSPNPSAPAQSHLGLPPQVLQQTRDALDQIFHAHSDAAVAIARGLKQRMPNHPIGYLLEVEADWWATYCHACEIRYNLIDAWSRGHVKQDDAYFALADRAIQLAEAQLSGQESAAMHLFAGMGYGLRARLHGLRADHLAVARTGVKGREHFLRALALDPQMGDALTGIGLYNYLADALSTFTKVLRFFMGIPGGNKKEGIQQLETAMATAELTVVEARYYLARNFRNFDQRYARSAELLEPLVAHYPDNPLFQLLLGDMYARLNRKDAASLHFHAAQQIKVTDVACAARVQSLAAAALTAIGR